MTTRPVTFKTDPWTLERLDAAAREYGLSRSMLLNLLVRCWLSLDREERTRLLHCTGDPGRILSRLRGELERLGYEYLLDGARLLRAGDEGVEVYSREGRIVFHLEDGLLRGWTLPGGWMCRVHGPGRIECHPPG